MGKYQKRGEKVSRAKRRDTSPKERKRTERKKEKTARKKTTKSETVSAFR